MKTGSHSTPTKDSRCHPYQKPPSNTDGVRRTPTAMNTNNGEVPPAPSRKKHIRRSTGQQPAAIRQLVFGENKEDEEVILGRTDTGRGYNYLGLWFPSNDEEITRMFESTSIDSNISPRLNELFRRFVAGEPIDDLTSVEEPKGDEDVEASCESPLTPP